MIYNCNSETAMFSQDVNNRLHEVDLLYKTVDEIGIEIIFTNEDSLVIKRPNLNNEYMQEFIDKIRKYFKADENRIGIKLTF